MTTRPSLFSRAQARWGVAAAIAAGCTRPGSVVADAVTGPDADVAAAAAEHLCRQALLLILRLSLSGRFLFRFEVTPTADAAAGVIVLQCRLTSTLPSTVI
jgi:hypothetical protein